VQNFDDFALPPLFTAGPPAPLWLSSAAFLPTASDGRSWAILLSRSSARLLDRSIGAKTLLGRRVCREPTPAAPASLKPVLVWFDRVETAVPVSSGANRACCGLSEYGFHANATYTAYSDYKCRTGFRANIL